jgi:hypothetical protein
MKVKKVLDTRVGDFDLLLERLQGDSALHDYGIPKRVWPRAVKLMKHFGSDRALEIIDQRAERAGDRGDFETSRRWRELIVAIHAMTEHELLPGDDIH